MQDHTLPDSLSLPPLPPIALPSSPPFPPPSLSPTHARASSDSSPSRPPSLSASLPPSVRPSPSLSLLLRPACRIFLWATSDCTHEERHAVSAPAHRVSNRPRVTQASHQLQAPGPASLLLILIFLCLPVFVVPLHHGFPVATSFSLVCGP